MAGKVILVFLLSFTVLLTSCYPQLSVQQYDKLRQDIAALDTERQKLGENVTALSGNLTALKSKNTETLAYVAFLDKLETTQVSQKLLVGQFDADAVLKDSANLTAMAKDLGDYDIIFFLDSMKPKNESQTMQAYYKIVEYTLKKIKANLDSTLQP